MTYANAQSRRIDPAGLTAAIAVNAAVVAALLTAAPHVLPGKPTSLATYTPTIAPPPEPLPPPDPVDRRTDPQPRPADSRIVAPRPAVPVPADSFTGVDAEPFVPDLRLDGGGTATIPGTADPVEPPSPPPLVAATPDPHFLDRLQPPYPPAKQRNEEEGRVRVRVLIGTDGRVRAIQPVGQVDDAFYAATRRQALSAWRFRPATRGGQAVENWQELTIRFVLQR